MCKWALFTYELKNIYGKIIYSVRIGDADDIIVNLTPANFIFYNPERSDIMNGNVNKTKSTKSYETLVKTVSYCLHKQQTVQKGHSKALVKDVRNNQ